MIVSEKFPASLIREVRSRIGQGEFQHRIAADLGVNQGRISEIKNGAPWVTDILTKEPA